MRPSFACRRPYGPTGAPMNIKGASLVGKSRPLEQHAPLLLISGYAAGGEFTETELLLFTAPFTYTSDKSLCWDYGTLCAREVRKKQIYQDVYISWR